MLLVTKILYNNKIRDALVLSRLKMSYRKLLEHATTLKLYKAIA